MSPEREILFSEEAEEAILAAAMFDEEAAEAVVEGLSDEDFYLPRHAIVWRAIRDTLACGATVQTVMEHIRDRGELDQIGGVAYLVGLDASLPALSTVPEIVSVLRNKSMRRRIVFECREAMRRAKEDATPAPEILGELRSDLDRIEQDIGPRSEAKRVGDVARVVVDSILRPEQARRGVPHGIPDLEKYVPRFEPGQLWTLAGATGGGKSSLAQNFMLHAGKSGNSVLMLSLEMTDDEIATRIVSSVSGVAHGRLRSHRPYPSERFAIESTPASLDEQPMWICDEAHISPNSALALARRHKRKHGLDLLIVDYAQLMRRDERYERRDLEVGAAVRAMAGGAKDLECPVMLVSQLNRHGNEKKQRPQLHQLRESGEIEQHSHGVILMWRPDPDGKPNVVELIVAKNRSGACGSVPVYFRANLLTFEPLKETA